MKSRVPVPSLSLVLLLALFIVFPLARPIRAADANTNLVLALRQVADGLTSPLNAVPLEDGSGRMLIGDQVGTIHLLNKEGGLAPELFGDLSGRIVKLDPSFDERGLLGLALHPKFRQNGRLFVFYSAPRRDGIVTNYNHTARLSEFHVRPEDKSKLDLASERTVLEIDKPQFNHNCGRLVFGPDGYLYVGVGDGGNANDEGFGHAPEGNGQTASTLLGKILRLDVDGGNPYQVPKDNPFVGKSGFRPEIFAYGLRNPWGMSFDRGGNREFIAADVGQNLFEEVNMIVAGGNYGWRIREGFEGFDPKSPNRPATNAPVKDAEGRLFRDPILSYKHPRMGRPDPSVVSGVSITGGYIYRGRALPHLVGRYVFGDWSRSWALPDGVLYVATRPADGNGPWTVEFLDAKIEGNGRLTAFITAFGEDADGELYVLTNGRSTPTGKTGKVFKLVAM